MTTADFPAYRTLTLRRAEARGMHPVQLTAAELFDIVESCEGDVVHLYESFGHVGGDLMFGTHHFRNDHERQAVDVLDSNGRVVLRYPVEASASHAAPNLILFRRPEK
jgi:NADPH-dependent glutamate synthase beta subunit-like oxidoreductase